MSWNIGAEKLYELCTELYDAGIDAFEYLTLTASNPIKKRNDEEKLINHGKRKYQRRLGVARQKKLLKNINGNYDDNKKLLKL